MEKSDSKTIQPGSLILDELDDELEEFEEIGAEEVTMDADASQWEEEWDVAGWDDEDADEDFVSRLQEELQCFKESLNKATEQKPEEMK